jgi:phenylacetate-CoA ligase
MDRIRGRRDDMLIIRGINVYPSEVERVLLSVPEVAPHYQLVVERPGALDQISLRCEPAHAAVDHAQLASRLEEMLHQQTGLRFQVEVLEPERVPRSEGKAVRVVDRRPSGVSTPQRS